MTPTTPKALLATNFQFEKQIAFYRGKVRDVYTFEGGLLAMVASDRISAFDVVLPAGIPFKGQVLNQIANYFLDATKDIVPNWKIAAPDPMVTIGYQAVPFKVEMVIRGNLTGHAWRTYQSGKRSLCGVTLSENLKENQYFENPIITPTTKAALGSHDEDISREEILAQGIVSAEDYEKLEQYTHALFARGREMAQEKGLILVDTKYEFGKLADGSIVLIDEIHTPDSSRYFLQDGFDDCVQKGIQPKQLSKEFVRQWLIENGFQGKAGQSIPEMSSAFIESVSERYIDLFETITGKKFERATTENLEKRVENAIANFID
ncbi:MAG: phosphoribosylaminoimidazolesuccinocarboxamide synthase [Schleiferiaceae bacterium]|nr:phosphoribosylaminoimidazolesuccinocarboxamide synthase [Schleiferiaceae bacterium]